MLKIWICRGSLALNLLVGVAALLLWLNAGALIVSFLEGNHVRKVSFFEHYPVQAGDVVFLGDSITDGGEWAEMFPAIATRNRGIGGDTTTGVLARLQQVTDGQPAALFIMIGTNDLTHGPAERQVSYSQYSEILQRVRDESPATVVYALSLLPRAENLRLEVEAYNREVQRLSADTGATYIDLYSHFLDADGSIGDAYSNDELHLNGPGYELWRSLLTQYVPSLAERGDG